MKAQKFILAVICFLFISEKSFSQDWLPNPVKSQYLDAILGTWTSAPYEFMGNTNNDVVTYNMILNGQYLEINVKRTDNKGFTYEGKEILTPSTDGSMKGTYYDILGQDKNSTYTARMEGDKIILNSANPAGSGTREIIIDGNTMVHNITFTMDDKSENMNPEQKITITYNKTN